MTFCTIEEAWGDSFFSMSNKETTVPEYFDEPDIKKVDKKKKRVLEAKINYRFLTIKSLQS